GFLGDIAIPNVQYDYELAHQRDELPPEAEHQQVTSVATAGHRHRHGERGSRHLHPGTRQGQPASSQRQHRSRRKQQRSQGSGKEREQSKSWPSQRRDQSRPWRSRLRSVRAATARKERIWEYGVIPYEIDSNFSGSHKALFKMAMRHWENRTCVKFVERSQTEHPSYILFTEKPCGCCSFVGRRGNGQQAISIGKNCDKFGIVVHELGHVVGFWHEHTRPDRDAHVQIVRENIMTGQEYNFNKLTEEEVNSLGLPYDYDSIMHYARNTFSKGTYLDTIQPREQASSKKSPEIGQRIRLSEGDVAQTNLLYKCSTPPNEGERCEWRITATHGERIVLNITDLDIYQSEDCRSDYLEIRDGYWQKSMSLGKFCGSQHPLQPIKSSGSRMLITYITSHKQNGHRGFIANYEAVCGGELDMETGHLESPNYPEDYPASKECVWKLTVPQDYQVALKFQSFEIEKHDNCVYDYLEVRDGHSENARSLGKFCGYKLPADIHSTGNKLLVKFVSDSSVQKSGFSATFMKEFDECALIDHGCEHHCINTLGGYECACKIGYELHSDGKHCEDACGGVFDAANGTITSPSFPELYPVNKNCIWQIMAPPQFRITLNFTHFDLEGNNHDCEYDSLEVHSILASETAFSHGVFCGSHLPNMITSESNSLRIEFSTDNSVQKTGFAAVFFTDMDECATNNGNCQHECRNTIGSYQCSCHNGFLLHDNKHDCKEGGCKYEVDAPTGQVTSPNYPDYYPSRKDCVWHFTTTPGHRIKLTFTEFEMEPHQECAYDHVVLYDGDSADAHTLGRFCGSKVPHPIVATSNQMFMVFKSDASYGDHNYENRVDCDWEIEAPTGKAVHLRFLTFELEYEQDCGYDVVEVFSGPDDVDVLHSGSDADCGQPFGRFCGTTKPMDIISLGETLLVRFRSDDTIVYKGFSASYIAVDQPEADERRRKR
ncbi:hypothetical protein B566_EDAN002674, partial [Ephemera danica]